MKELNQILKEVEELNNYLVIVEGIRDEKALKELNVYDVKSISGKELNEFIAHLPKTKKIVILTDFDEEGVKLAKKLKKFLKAYGYDVDDAKRKEFRKKFRITKIEELIDLKNTYKKKVSKVE